MVHYIDEVDDLKGVRVLLRLDLNVPIIDGVLTDPYRLERVIETIDFLRSKDAQTIIIAHCEGTSTVSETLVPMWHYLNGYFPVDFSPTYFTPEAIDKLLKLENKGVLMFENLRINSGEKTNDSDFAQKLSGMADIYVNDAFSVSHRKHASIVGVPQFIPHYGGLLMRQEIEHLSKAFNPEHPFMFILGGAKFDTKLPLITKYLDKADYVFVGGALSNNIFRERGFNTGKSLVAEGDFGIKEMLSNKKLLVPVDLTVTKPDGGVSFVEPENVTSDDMVVDSGPQTIHMLKDILKDAHTVVWNGPLGNYEIGFHDKTEQLAIAISECSAESIVGGGDTLASIKTLGLNGKFGFISTGGGAMLDYLVEETLPGIDALEL
ncbi:MAG: Phosphoglycerate kinase [Patescibacteria group bacterium]|nr:Phosphoglycerate kinase [Patescibacteria group bacterium]